MYIRTSLTVNHVSGNFAESDNSFQVLEEYLLNFFCAIHSVMTKHTFKFKLALLIFTPIKVFLKN